MVIDKLNLIDRNTPIDAEIASIMVEAIYDKDAIINRVYLPDYDDYCYIVKSNIYKNKMTKLINNTSHRMTIDKGYCSNHSNEIVDSNPELKGIELCFPPNLYDADIDDYTFIIKRK